MLPLLGALLDPSADGSVVDPDNTGPTSNVIPLTSINAVAAHLPHIDAARSRITADMESMVINGLATLVSLSQIRAPPMQLIDGRFRRINLSLHHPFKPLTTSAFFPIW